MIENCDYCGLPFREGQEYTQIGSECFHTEECLTNHLIERFSLEVEQGTVPADGLDEYYASDAEIERYNQRRGVA